MANRNKRLNVAVIGLGMGYAHLKSFLSYPRANVVGICDSDRARLATVAKELGILPQACFSDYRELLAVADSLDLHAVSVALPNKFHAPVTIDAFKAGLHVLCEKPMAMNASQSRAMIAAGNKARRKLMINFSFRFTPQSRALKRLVDSGAVGDIYFGRTVWHRRRGIPRFGGWFGIKEFSGGGPIIDLGVHRLDLAMWLMGNPRPVSVSGSTYCKIARRLAREQDKRFDVEDLGCALIRFDNGATLILEASWAGYSEKREEMVTQLLGSKGGIIQRNLNEGYEFEACVFTEQSGTLWSSRYQESTVAGSAPYQEFVDSVLDDRVPLATGRHGLDVQLILDAVYKSATVGREIRISEKI